MSPSTKECLVRILISFLVRESRWLCCTVVILILARKRQQVVVES
uniref:Uncharacterized protein n=1 Tax=Arundo donax TaxID=35708 RepID=A0A0A9A4G4_ARUDO